MYFPLNEFCLIGVLNACAGSRLLEVKAGNFKSLLKLLYANPNQRARTVS